LSAPSGSPRGKRARRRRDHRVQGNPAKLVTPPFRSRR
jgi:hypothetical protein